MFKKLSIVVYGIPVSPPVSPLLEDTKKSVITLQVALVSPLLSPPLEADSFPDLHVSHDYDNQQSSLFVLEPQPFVALIGVGYISTHLVEAIACYYNVIVFDLSNKRLFKVAEQLDGLPIQSTSSASKLH